MSASTDTKTVAASLIVSSTAFSSIVTSLPFGVRVLGVAGEEVVNFSIGGVDGEAADNFSVDPFSVDA